MKNSYNKRIVELDCIKGILIVLMVFGHCMQLWSGNDYLEGGHFYDNMLFKMIYSFHLPLFAIISGYLFYFKHDKPLFVNLSKLFWNLFVPIITWSLLFKLYQFVYLNIDGNVTFSICDILYFIVTNLWFLWAIMWNSLLMIALQKWKSDNVLVCSTILLFILFVPSFLQSHLYFFLTPFFFCGYLINKYNVVANIDAHNKVITLLSLLVWGGLLFLFSRSTYIYDSKIYLFEWGVTGWKSQLFNDVLRTIIGVAASLFVFCTIKFLYIRYNDSIILNFFSKIGKVSLGIYIISLQINMVLLPVIGSRLSKSIVVNVVETIIIVAFCVGMVGLVNKSKNLNMFLLGSRS